MDRLEYSSIAEKSDKTKPRNKKRKWREIEDIHEKKRLMEELKSIDISLEHQVERLKNEVENITPSSTKSPQKK
jgi:anti-sigma28 factor (negative regulator of flagellin synthesis)